MPEREWGFREFRGRVELSDRDQAMAARAAARAYCLEHGHDIGRTAFQQRADGVVVINAYGCSNCDVKVELSYPE